MELNQFPWRWEGDIQKSQNFDLSRLLLSHRLDFEVWYNIISLSCTKGHSAPSSRTASKYKYGAGFSAGGVLANDPKMTKNDKKNPPSTAFLMKKCIFFFENIQNNFDPSFDTFKTDFYQQMARWWRYFIKNRAKSLV